MKKMSVLILLAVFLMPLAAPQIFAADETTQAGITDVGNKMCPVMGGPVSGKDFVVYEGKRYGLCCPGCDKKFLNDPAHYIAQMEAKEKVSASTASTVSSSEEMEKDMEQGSL